MFELGGVGDRTDVLDHQGADEVGAAGRQPVGDHPAHGVAEQEGRPLVDVFEEGDGVVDERVASEVAAVVGESVAALVEGDDPELRGQVRGQGGEGGGPTERAVQGDQRDAVAAEVEEAEASAAQGEEGGGGHGDLLKGR